MKKISFILMIYSLFALPIGASSKLVATLYHAANDSTSVYYGVKALEKAHAAAVDGDVITLSSGAFTACTITKEITIRGAGMETDSLNNVAPTVLEGDFNVYTLSTKTPSNDGHVLYMEDLACRGEMTIGLSDYGNQSLRKAQFKRCYLDRIFTPDHYTGVANIDEVDSCSFTQCKIGIYEAYGTSIVSNSIVSKAVKGDNDYINCYVAYIATAESRFINSIVSHEYSISATNECYSCIGYPKNIFDGLYESNRESNYSFEDEASIFKPNGNPYELQDSIKTNYLGIDGTQVGIYGGPAPFTPYTEVPKIKKFHVANKSTAEGKLSVDIEVTTPQ